jgi:hypothetical protein
MPRNYRKFGQVRRALPLLAAALIVTACGHDKPAAAPAANATAAPHSSASYPWVPSPSAGVPGAGSAAAAARAMGAPPAQAPAPPAVPTAEASGALPGTRTCAALTAAVTQATLMDPGVVAHIVTTSATADAPVADAAQRLAAAYAKAANSLDTAQEPDAVAAVSAAAADMAGVCAESGLESAG